MACMQTPMKFGSEILRAVSSSKGGVSCGGKSTFIFSEGKGAYHQNGQND